MVSLFSSVFFFGWFDLWFLEDLCCTTSSSSLVLLLWFPLRLSDGCFRLLILFVHKSKEIKAHHVFEKYVLHACKEWFIIFFKRTCLYCCIMNSCVFFSMWCFVSGGLRATTVNTETHTSSWQLCDKQSSLFLIKFLNMFPWVLILIPDQQSGTFRCLSKCSFKSSLTFAAVWLAWLRIKTVNRRTCRRSSDCFTDLKL